jgi:hypothetical protein
MVKDLLVFRSAHKEKDTVGLVFTIGDGYMTLYNYGYNYHPIGQYSVQTDSIFYDIQIFLKSLILIRKYYD